MRKNVIMKFGDAERSLRWINTWLTPGSIGTLVAQVNVPQHIQKFWHIAKLPNR